MLNTGFFLKRKASRQSRSLLLMTAGEQPDVYANCAWVFNGFIPSKRNLKCHAASKISFRRAAQCLPEMTIICLFTARVKMSSFLLSLLQKLESLI